MPIMKKATEKTRAKGTPVAGKPRKAAKGDKYACDVCGLVVSVDTICGCIDTCDILCCGKPMKHKKMTTRSK